MRIVYTSTLCVSSEKSPTCCQILPILQKLEKHFTVVEEDAVFVSSIKQAVWENLSKRYQVNKIFKEGNKKKNIYACLISFVVLNKYF